MLFQWGVVTFKVYPVNVDKMDHLTNTDWSRKEIAGAATYREWVGEGDEQINLRGSLFPRYFALQAKQRKSREGGGLEHIELLDNMRRLGQAQMLIRGDGWVFGWFVLERLARGHTLLDAAGIGQRIDFDATFQRVPVPDPKLVASAIMGAGGM